MAARPYGIGERRIIGVYDWAILVGTARIDADPRTSIYMASFPKTQTTLCLQTCLDLWCTLYRRGDAINWWGACRTDLAASWSQSRDRAGPAVIRPVQSVFHFKAVPDTDALRP